MRRMADQGANEQDKRDELTFWQVLKSTIAGALGVQSRAHRERDRHGCRALHPVPRDPGRQAAE